MVTGHRRGHPDRLGTIVGSAMGYEPEDLPWEVPLIELGLDSLMAVRIKNRVEYDFDLPPIQLTAVRDANLYAVEKLIEYAIEHRDEVEELARAPEEADAGGDRGRAGRADGRRHHGRRARREAGRAVPCRDRCAVAAAARPSAPSRLRGRRRSDDSRRCRWPPGGAEQPRRPRWPRRY